MSKRELLKIVSKSQTFWWLVTGYGAFMFFAGGLSFWAPRVIHEMYGIPNESSSLFFGLCTVVSGILGTALGGKLMDKINKKYANSDKPRAKNIPADSLRAHLAARISALMTLASIAFIIAAPFSPDYVYFFALIAPAELLLFATTAPCNIAILMSVPEAARGQALGLSVTVAHLLGDVPSPWIIGKIYKSFKNHQEGGFVAMQVCGVAVVVCALLWFIGSKVARSEGALLYRKTKVVA